MKRIIALVLALLFIFSLSACGKKEADMTKPEETKMGIGIYTVIEGAQDASAEKNGKFPVSTTVATITLDKDEKIVDCRFDALDFDVPLTADGKAPAIEIPETKYNLKDAYAMKEYGGAKYEWYEQADRLAKVAKGKSLAEVKKLLAEDGKGNEDVISAGCTIEITGFVRALEKAFQNANN